jgi:hypothetical protein
MEREAKVAITQAVCTTFKVELMQGLHNFTLTTGNVFKVAMYLSSATLSAATTVYSSSGEVAASGGYSAGGTNLTNVTPTNPSGTTAITDFADATWAASTIANARGALIYNSTNGNRAVIVLDFGADKSSSAGDFTIQFPTPDISNAIIRIV